MSAITGWMGGWGLGAGKKRENNKYNPRAVNHSNKCGENIVGPNRKTVRKRSVLPCLGKETARRRRQMRWTRNLKHQIWNSIMNSHWPRYLLVFSTDQMFVLWGQEKVNMFYCNKVRDLFTAFSNATQTKKILYMKYRKIHPNPQNTRTLMASSRTLYSADE